MIRFEASTRESIDLLDRFLFPSLGREMVPSNPGVINVRLLEREGESQLVIDDVRIASAARPEVLLRILIDWLDREVVKRLTGLHAIHAGAVLLGGKALLLPGSSHSGKSSLVAELLRRGATCFSDEYALIDGDGRVHAYPRVLLVRNGTPVQTPVTAQDLNAQVASAPAQVGWVLSVRYESSATWSVAPIPLSTALLTLLQNTPHVLAERPEMVGAFQRAVEHAVCCSGRRGEASEAADQILQLVATA